MTRFLCVVLALPLCAASRVTVQQLAEILDSARAGHTADAEIAADLSRLQLKERLPSASLSLLEHGMGEKTMQALELIADESAFLDPPASAVAHGSVPSPAEQRAIVHEAQKYVLDYVRVLPNLVCTETTSRFDDLARRDFQLRDVIRGELTVIGGSESFRPQKTTFVPGQRTKRMTSSGEFGSILAAVFATGTTRFVWQRWEMVDAVREAVFAYAVPEADSRFTVFWYGAVSEHQARGMRRRSAYQGEISIDPASGAIVRLTQQAANLPPDFPIERDDTAVEYRAVELGGEVWLCPARSITMIDELPLHSRKRKSDAPHSHYLNRVEFAGYHRFKAESKVLSDVPGEQ